MPKTMYVPKDATSSGIDITWTKSASRIDIGGWYHGYTGIRGESMTLREFFDRLGITEKECKKAWKEEK